MREQTAARWLVLLPCAIACSDVTGVDLETISFCRDFIGSSWIAVRNESPTENGPEGWRRIDIANGEFTFEAESKLSIAFIFSETPIATQLEVYQLTAAEVAKITCQRNDPMPLNRSHSGTIAGLGPEQTATVLLGSGIAGGGNGPYSLANTRGGPHDLIAFRRGGAPPLVLSSMIVRRNLDLPNGASIPTLDFASAEAVAPLTHMLTVVGTSNEETTVASQDIQLTGTGFNVWGGVLGTPSATLYGLPSGIQTAGDFYRLIVEGAGPTSFRQVWMRYPNPQDRVVTLGPPLASPTVSLIAESNPSNPSRFRAAIPFQAEYGNVATASFTQATPTHIHSVVVTVTKAFVGDVDTWQVEMPYFAGFPGFETAIGFTSQDLCAWETVVSDGWFQDQFSRTAPLPDETLRLAMHTGGTSCDSPQMAITPLTKRLPRVRSAR